jgi:hypothetical protein
MKTSRLITILLTVVLCAVSTETAFAKRKLSKAKPTPTPKKVNAHSATILSISRGAISIKSPSETLNYRIDYRTSITLDGSTVAVDALRRGMYADVTPSGLDPGLAMSITATNQQTH